MSLSDNIEKDTTVVVQVQDYNIRYTYSIKRFGDSYTFQQLDKERMFVNYKAITGSMYFFGAWAAMVGHSYIKEDKVLHFAAGELAGGAGYAASKLLKLKYPIVNGIIFGTIVGASKELIYDKEMNRGVPSFRDGLWTAVGAAFGAFTMKLVF